MPAKVKCHSTAGRRVVATKVEFGSAAWAEAAGRVLAQVVKEYGSQLAGQAVAAREVYANAPVQLGGPRITFTFRITDGAVSVSTDESEPVDMVVEMDFAAARAGAHTVLGKSAQDIEARTLRRRAAIEAGTVKAAGDIDWAPLVMRQALVDWHNRLAELID
jgi:hypothetical protein